MKWSWPLGCAAYAEVYRHCIFLLQLGWEFSCRAMLAMRMGFAGIPMLMFIGYFVWVGEAQEAALAG